MANQNDNYTENSLTKNDSINTMSTLVIVEQYMSIYGSFVLTTLGVIGNILSILIFLSPRYRRQSSHFYLLSLALSDLCFLIINLLEDTFRNHNELYQSRINILDRSSPIICIFIQYARNTTRLLSSWIIVSFTIERLLVVFHPLKRAIICRRKIARFVVLFIFLMSLLININVPFHYGIINVSNYIENDDTICDILPKYRSIYMRFAISTMITVYLVPMCIIGIVNMLICCKLWRKSLLTEKDEKKKSNKQRKTLKHSRHLFSFSDLLSCLHSSSNSRLQQIEQSNKSQTSSCSQYQSVGSLTPIDTNVSKVNGSLLNNENQNNSQSLSYSNPFVNYPTNIKQSSTQVKTYIQSRTNRVTLTLLLVSCSFLLLNSPYCAVWIANYVHGFRNATLKSIKEITELFMLTNFCINFVLYCLSGKIFRVELMYLIRCQWKELYKRNEKGSINKKYLRSKMNIQLQQSKLKLHSNQYSNRNQNN